MTTTLQVGCLFYFDVPLASDEIDDSERQREIAEGVLRGTLERVQDLPLISEDMEVRYCLVETVEV